MMKTTIAIEMLHHGSGDNEISNDDNDDSDSNDKDRVYTGQSCDIIRGLKKEDRLPPKGRKQVYPSLPKFTLVDEKSVLNALCPHKRAQKGPDCPPSKDYLCFLSTRGGFGGPSEVEGDKGSSAVPPYSLGRDENFGVLATGWQSNLASPKVILIQLNVRFK